MAINQHAHQSLQLESRARDKLRVTNLLKHDHKDSPAPSIEDALGRPPLDRCRYNRDQNPSCGVEGYSEEPRAWCD